MSAGDTSGILFVLSAPSGTGKSTLVRRLLDSVEGLRFSVSYTTRPRRPDETHGEQYHFVSEEEFDRMEREGAFLESARVHAHRYGTGREVTENALAAGRDVLLDVDIQGARRVRGAGVAAVFVFLLPPSYETLERRLRERGSDSEEQILRRLAVARAEVLEFRDYDYVVVNDDLDRAVEEVRSILTAERCRVARRRGQAESILESFPREERTGRAAAGARSPEE